MIDHGETVWTFDTARFRVALELFPEYDDPADIFQFDEDIDAVRNGDVLWFCASVAVYFDGREIARDYLGGCAYERVEDFFEAHRDPDPMNRNCTLMRAARGENVVICHYFPDKVRTAVREARAALRDLQAVPVRSVA